MGSATPTNEGLPGTSPVRPPLRIAGRLPPWIVVLAILAAIAVLVRMTWTLVSRAPAVPGADSLTSIGWVMLAAAICAWMISRVETRRRGLAPTSDERFSWLDHPERRAAYEAEFAPRLPGAVRFLEAAYKPLFFGGYAVAFFAEPLARLVWRAG